MRDYVGLGADKVGMGQILREYFCFSSSVPFDHCSIIMFVIYHRRYVILDTGSVLK